MTDRRGETDGLTKIQDALEFLRISRTKLYQLMDTGELRFVKFGKTRRIPWSELHRLVEVNMVVNRCD